MNSAPKALPARKTREAEPAQDSSVFPIPGVFPLLIFAHLTVPQARGNQTVVDGAVRIAGRVVMKDDVQAITHQNLLTSKQRHLAFGSSLGCENSMSFKWGGRFRCELPLGASTD